MAENLYDIPCILGLLAGLMVYCQPSKRVFLLMFLLFVVVS